MRWLVAGSFALAATAMLLAYRARSTTICVVPPKARVDELSLQELARSVIEFRARTGRLPTDLAELARSRPSGTPEASPPASDQWAVPFLYVSDVAASLPAGSFLLGTLGRDGVSGGADLDADQWLYVAP